jgi:hypothetical protein
MREDAFVGWRSWRWSPATGSLHSMVWDFEWPRMERAVSEVTPRLIVYPRTDEDKLRNAAGLHAWRERGQLQNLIRLDEETIPVFGEVSLWGRVAEHSGGFRAEFAYPYSLLVMPGDREHLSALSAAYGVEATTL